MTRPRSTFEKLRREQEKRSRAQSKLERRATRKEGAGDEESTEETPDQDRILAELARLHEELADGQISLERFDERQEELRSKLRVD